MNWLVDWVPQNLASLFLPIVSWSIYLETTSTANQPHTAQLLYCINCVYESQTLFIS